MAVITLSLLQVLNYGRYEVVSVADFDLWPPTLSPLQVLNCGRCNTVSVAGAELWPSTLSPLLALNYGRYNVVSVARAELWQLHLTPVHGQSAKVQPCGGALPQPGRLHAGLRPGGTRR